MEGNTEELRKGLIFTSWNPIGHGFEFSHVDQTWDIQMQNPSGY